jgi:3-deoxy-D-manno-octulosonic-acid transferase
MTRALYSLVIYLLAPLVFASNLWRGLRDRTYWDRLAERFGCTKVRRTHSLWVHAVSVGEVQAAAALVHSLQKHFPQLPLVMTTSTPTGASRVASLFGPDVQHCYLPYDLPGSVRRFLDRVQPRLAVIVETELWPNLYRECRRRGVPLLIASARLSPRSLPRYQRLRALIAPALAGVHVGAQTAEDLQRFQILGADPQRMQIVGNIKFDIEVSADTLHAGREFRALNAAARPVWIAASTHAGEEAAALSAHEGVRKILPDALLLLVPRHPQRFADVRQLLHSRGTHFAVRSAHEPVAADTSVLLVDTLGELLMFYAASDVAFVGGSLVPVGGHNFLEPAALDLPVLSGPAVFNMQQVSQAFFDEGAALRVDSAGDLAQRIIELLQDPARRTAIGMRGANIIARNRGAVLKVMAMIQALLMNRP